MYWFTAQAWAANLNVNGVTGWRLPSLVDTGAAGCDGGSSGADCGANVNTSTSEMAHLLYVTLGNKAFYDTAGYGPQSGWGLTNTGPFKNVQADNYWIGVEYAPYASYAWYFNTYALVQGFSPENGQLLAWAVHPGDVPSVPEPDALALMGLGLAAIALRRRSSSTSD